MEREDFIHEVEHYLGPIAKIDGKEIEMAVLTFTIANIYDPKEGKKVGSIKTTEDKWVSYWPSDKNLFQVGGTYKALCDEREWNGTMYYTVKSPGKGGKVEQEAAPTEQGGAMNTVNVSQPVGISKDDTITRLAIAKSCIEAHESHACADAWYAWVMRQDIPEDAPASVDPLDQEIPF